jgi:hypothetical protein
MRNRKNYLLAAIGGFALIGVGTLLSPRRSEAQYSSPVRVMNTSAAPALNSRIDDPGRIPYIAGFSNSCLGTNCSTTFLPVPAGHRVVIQSVSAALVFNAPPTQLTGFLRPSGNTTSQIQFVVPATATVGNVAFFNQPIQYYVDGGQSPQFIFTSGAAFNSSAGQNLTLVGYELDCNAAPCAAIATQ